MIMHNIFKNNNDRDIENIGHTVLNKAIDTVKDLSGKDAKFTRKVVDNVIVVTNAAGGCGASTITANVAYMANKMGFKVIVIDLNIMYPIQYSYFGIKQQVECSDLVSFLFGNNAIGASIDSTNDVNVLYANNRTLTDSIKSELDTCVSNFQTAINNLRQLYDIVLIDTPMRVDNKLCNIAFYLADQVYMVWDEGISSIANAEKIRRNMSISGIDVYNKMKAILNKRTDIAYTRYPFDKLGFELIKVLPFNSAIIESSLKSSIFCEKGASSSDSATDFYTGIKELTSVILENGGYIQ